MGTTSSQRDKLAAAYLAEEEIYLLLRGSGDMVAGLDANRKEVRHPVTEGAVFFFKPGTQVGYYSNAREGQPHDLILAVRSQFGDITSKSNHPVGGRSRHRNDLDNGPRLA